ncbi:MAG: M24 family metallopeptidase [Chloroflexota bacterium]|nr:M24 family metallopeptidase [Chloroflexota bacterium]
MKVELRHVPLLDMDVPSAPPPIPSSEYEARARALYAAAEVDWVVVYGDREHNASLLYLCGFDPRFEEALLLLGPGDRRILVVGNEGVVHASVAGLSVEVVLCQSLSLLAQPRDVAPRLRDVLRAAGLGPGQQAGVTGWKYLEADETDDPTTPAFVPAFLIRDIHEATGSAPRDVTAELMHPVRGLRVYNSAAQIAAFEWAAARVGRSVLRVVRGTEPGMTEMDAAGLLGYSGEPLSMHPIVASGAPGEPINGLRSPGARRLGRGDGITVGVGYWGSLSCRAGLLTEGPEESFLDRVVRPYYAAIASWYATMRVGVTGGEVHAAVHDTLAEAGADFRPMLNPGPGHQISYDEWLHSPIRAGSDERIASGMIFQCDIIPTPLPAGTALNCEDTVAVADASLRDELARDHPDLWRRVEVRRAFMERALGLQLPADVLPLSYANAYLPPFWLDDALVCMIDG